MKTNCKKYLSLTLSAALLFGVCAVSSKKTAAADTMTADITNEAFSSRDLSGEYDISEAVTITLDGSTVQTDSDTVQISGSNLTITAAGTYLLSGSLENGSIIVDADKEDKVQLVLDGASIHSDTFAALYVLQADKVFVTLADGTTNTLSNGGSFRPIDENDVDAAIYAKDDITFNGTGSLQISSPAGHGIVGKDEVTITGGTYEIEASGSAVKANDSIAIADGTFTLTAGKDGLHAENNDDETLGSIYIAGGSFVIKVSDDAIHATTLLQIDGGSFNLTGEECLEATYIKINDGDISISASDDGVNASAKSSIYTPTIEINGGTLTIVMAAGDTDAVDSNGNLIVNGGTIDITAQSPFDYDGMAQYNGGTIIVNGQTVNTITNQMMGGMGGMNGMRGMENMNGGMGERNGMRGPRGKGDMNGNTGDWNGMGDTNGDMGNWNGMRDMGNRNENWGG